MASEITSDRNPAPGLPPVEPPTARLLARMFLVPFLIVTVVVAFGWGLVWTFSGIVGTTRTPAQFLRNLDNANAEVRWRAASDLAQVLLRDDQLASDPGFALDLAERLQRLRQDNARSEQALLELLRNQASGAAAGDEEAVVKARKQLEQERAHLLYLCSCLGNFTIPVGTELIADLAERNDGAEEAALRQRRRHAVWTLACLGNRLERFGQLPAERQEQVRGRLREESEAAGDRGTWARTALDYLDKGKLPAVDRALAAAAGADDPYLRKQAAMAMTFWPGGDSERTLVGLLRDDGRGADREDETNRPLPPGELQKRYALEIQYQALLALARRGSPEAGKHLDTLAEMLDHDQLLQTFRTQQQGKDIGGADQAHETVLSTLRAVAELHRRQPDLDLSKLTPALQKLKDNVNPTLRAEAERTRLILAENAGDRAGR